MFTAACSSSGSGSSNEKTSGTAAAAATGSPITIAFADNESSLIEAQDGRYGITAAVDWVNKEKGGVAGHPIKLVTCSAQGTPESNSVCANQLVGDHPAAMVIEGVTDETDYVNATKAAGMPIFVAQGSGTTLTSGNGFSLNAGVVGLYAAAGAYAKTKSMNSIGLMVIDVPAVTVPEQTAATDYHLAGLTTDQFNFPATTADMTPVVAAAVAKKPDIIFQLSTPQDCTSSLPARISLGYTGPYIVSNVCSAPSVIGAVGGAANGTYTLTNLGMPTPGSTNADDQLYQHIMSTYAPSGYTAASQTYAANAMASFMALYQGVLLPLKGSVTAPTALAQAKKINNLPIFLGMGAKATCNGSVAPGLPGACSGQYLMYQYEHGGWQFVQVLDGSTILH
jgi:branched-chain amino acid transport system substrate-binding protein